VFSTVPEHPPILAAAFLGFITWNGPAVAQSGASDNAADIYREAFELIKSLPPEDSELLWQYRSGEIGMTSEVRAALSRAQPAIRLFERASAVEHIDWGIDYSQGPATLLPHLSPMRMGVQLLSVEAQARLDSGDTRGAAQLYAAGYRMSDQVTQDPVLINSLVGLAMTTLEHNAIDEAIGMGLLGPAESRIILEAATPVAGAEDPLGMVAAFEGERTCFSQWLQDNYMGEGGMERFVEEMLPLLGVFDETNATAAPFMDMEQTAFNAAIMSYDLALEHAVAAVSMEDLGAAREEMARIEADTEAGLYGPLAPLVLPALDRALESFIRGYQRFDSTIDKLEELRDNPDAQQSLRNAAYWYLRAIEQWNAQPAEKRELVLAGRDEESERPKDEVVAALTEAEPIIDIILEAATIERCDFDLDQTWKYQGMNVELSHIDGLLELAKLMSAEARRRVSDGADRSNLAAGARLAAIFHMANHLGMDGQLRSTSASIHIAEIGVQCRSAIADEFRPMAAWAQFDRAITLLASSQFGLRRAAYEYPAFTIEWMIARGGVRASDIEISFAHDPDDPQREVLTTTFNGFDEQTRAGLSQALRELVREWSSGIARTGGVTDESRAMRDRFNRTWPAAFADWLLDPLEEAVWNVDAALRRLEDPAPTG
jgi:hypothetical protein